MRALARAGGYVARSLLSSGDRSPDELPIARPTVALAGQALRYGIAFATVVMVHAFIYYLGTNRKMTLRTVLPGAALATLLWLLATMGFAWYVRHLVNYNVLYGSVGAGLALLVWMYLLAVISLYGCEFNAAGEGESRLP